MKKKVKSRHAYEFCVLIIELLFNATLNPGPKTEASPMQIKDLLQKKVGPFLRSLFVTTIFKISDETILDETKYRILLLSNPILNQDLKRMNDFKEWKIKPLFKKKFEIFQVYKFKTKYNDNGLEKSEKEETNLSENQGNSPKKLDLTEEDMLMKFHSLVQEKGLKEINFKDLSFANSKQLGFGGSRRVHKGTYLKKDVAIKEYMKCNLYDQEFEENNRSLLEELQKIKKLCFPKVNKCYGICVNEKGKFYTVHELAECSLEQKLKAGKLSIKEKHKITSQILEIMLNLAEIKIIHRDLKPENFLITNQEEVQICDFGTIRELKHEITLTKNNQNTPYYAPPEFFDNTQGIGLFSDIWSLGIILYRIYYEKQFWDGYDLYQIMYSFCEKKIPKLDFHSNVPPEITEIIHETLMIEGEKESKLRKL